MRGFGPPQYSDSTAWGTGMMVFGFFLCRSSSFPLQSISYLPANEHNDCERELGMTGFIVLNRNLSCSTDASLSNPLFSFCFCDSLPAGLLSQLR